MNKRDSLTAELERDPQFSTAKRHQSTQLFTNSITHASLERQLLQAHTLRIDLETKLAEKELDVKRLERDRRHFADREREERDARQLADQQHHTFKISTEADLQSLRTQLTLLQESQNDLQDAHSQLSLSSAQTTASHKSLIASLTTRNTLLESQLSSAHNLNSSHLQTILHLQNQLDDLQQAKDESAHSITDQQDLTVVRQELKRQADYLSQLERTNARINAELLSLRERHTSIQVLREQIRSLEDKVAYTESLRSKLISLEAELAAAHQERQSWASRNLSTSPPPSPSKTPSVSETQTLTSLRLEHASLLEQHGSTLASLRALESTNTTLTSQLASATALVDSLQVHIETEKAQQSKDVIRARLAEHEVAFLKALLASYQAEETALDELKADELKVQRIVDLESLLSEYKATLASLPPPSSLPSADVLAEIDRLKSELSTAEHANTHHLERIDSLEQQLFELGGEIAGGRHIPPNTRVLQLAENPEKQWFDLRQSTMDKLKQENSALLKRLHDLEVSLASSSSQPPSLQSSSTRNQELVPRASYDLLEATNTSLKDELAKKEKRFSRLDQVFRAKAAEFKEAVAAILGVKLAFYPNGQVRVTSMFDLNASFVFQQSKTTLSASILSSGKSNGGGEMKMQLIAQGEGGPQDLPSLMRYWIENEQCPPGFIASVTLECYEKAKAEADSGGKATGTE